ncbi:MAG: hypothetical protein GXY55_19245 [Phycisphaerae bacterium]|nr:hypothetical protein [Phycisphaerae bacterium]
MTELEDRFEQEVDALHDRLDPNAVTVERTHLRPRKSDITVVAVGLCWTPWRKAIDGMAVPA